MTAAPNNVTAIPLHRRVAANVRAETSRIGYTQVQLSEILGLAQQLVSNRLRGKTPFTLDELDILAPYLGMTPEELITGVRSSPPPPSPIGSESRLSESNRRPSAYKDDAAPAEVHDIAARRAAAAARSPRPDRHAA